MPTFEVQLPLPHRAAEVYAWHSREGALQRLVPPWDGVELVRQSGDFAHREVELRVPAGPFASRWVARHEDVIEGEQFVDAMVSGPFASWRHSHLFTADPTHPGHSILTDRISWSLPAGSLGQIVAGGQVERTLTRMFAFRHRRTAVDLMRHALFADQPRLRVAISGASGLVGRALSAYLTTAGHTVLPLVRRAVARDEAAIAWDPTAGTVDLDALATVDAVVHLAGENVGERWTAARKQAIRDSRIHGTRTLAQALATLRGRPTVLISASAVGWYGDTGGNVVDEQAPCGDGFLASVCADWEAAADAARAAGLRVVHPRLGVVLTSGGGALAKMLPAFRSGGGGPIGGGKQGFPWVALDDVLAAIEQMLHDPRLVGPVNVVAPGTLSQGELACALGEVLHRPASLPLPAWAVRTLMGEMGTEMLVAGQRVEPRRLQHTGFSFVWPEVRDLLRFELGMGT
jgi:uncharacterized protein (TIGR01777 family)